MTNKKIHDYEIKIKLFFTFLLLYSFFIHSVGWNEQTRILSSISIVDEGRIDIDNYANLTGDRVYYNNHYYSDKAPGTSFLLTYVYNTLKLLTSDKYDSTRANGIFLPQPQFNTTIYTDVNPATIFKLTNIMGTILLSSLPGSLIVVLIYIILLELTKDQKNSLVISFIFGLGTIIFSYSTVLMGNIFSLLIILLIFYLSFVKEETSPRYIFLNGLLLGFSIVFDYLSIIFIFLYFIFIFRKIKKHILYFISGFIIGVAPLFIYNFFIFHNPFTISTNYPDPDISPCFYGNIYLSYCGKEYPIYYDFYTFVFKILRLLFYPYRGLFIYMPFLLFSLFGLKKLYEKNRELSIFIILLFLLYLVANGYYAYWFGGASFGPRYLLVVLPFLSIPLVYLIKSDKKIYYKFILIILLSISIFHIILGTGGNWEGVVVYVFENNYSVFVDWYGKTFWTDKISILNPLYEHYLPMFLENGPRSRILEYSIIGEMPDIRDLQTIKPREIPLFALKPFGILVLKTSFLIVPILLFVVILIWRKEIFGRHS